MDILSVLALATQCVTAAPPPIVAALAVAETNGAVYSLQIDGEHTALTDFDEAVQATALGLLSGSTVKVGIANLSTQEFDNRGVSYSEGFSACRNMEIAGEILRESWERFGSQDEHWRLAALEMAMGNPGIDDTFAQKFDLAWGDIQEIIQNHPNYLPKPSVKVDNHIQAVSPPIADNLPPSEPSNISRSWDVYERSSSSPLVVFSK